MQKKELRKYYLNQRKNFTTTSINEKSHQIAQLFFSQFNLESINYLHIFLPIENKQEINTWLIIREIWQKYPHIQIVAPKMLEGQESLNHHLLTEDTSLTNNKWNIPEPVNSPKVAEDLLDLILIPLLIADQQGFRVGYGKGFYDRFLPHCKSKALKVGLSYFEPILKISDVDKYDIPLDFLISAEQVHAFSPLVIKANEL